MVSYLIHQVVGTTGAIVSDTFEGDRATSGEKLERNLMLIAYRLSSRCEQRSH